MTPTPAAETAIIGKNIDGQWLKFVGEVPGGLERVVDLAKVEDMTVEEISGLYSELAGVSPKKFSKKAVAVESLLYQAAKLRTFGESASASVSKAAPAGTVVERTPRKRAETIEFIPSAATKEVVEKLCPQARGVVATLIDMASAANKTVFNNEEVEAGFQNTPHIKTVQGALRIYTYYKAKLVSAGIIRVTG